MACKLLVFRLRPIVLQEAHSDNYLVPFRALKLSDFSRKLLAALIVLQEAHKDKYILAIY
jgi:hypothetical protein